MVKGLFSHEFLRKGSWKLEKDKVLLNHVNHFSPKYWSSIRSKGLPQRIEKSCRLRWASPFGDGGTSSSGGLVRKCTDANNKIGGSGGNKNESAGGEGDKDDLVLQDTFAHETVVMVKDPNMLRYIEQELAKKRGRTVKTIKGVKNDLKQTEEELYKIPEHLKVKRRNYESSTQWTRRIVEVQLLIELKLFLQRDIVGRCV